MENKGILNKKLKTYYSDVNLDNYIDIYLEGIKNYKGKEFLRILDIGGGVGSFGEAVKPFNKNVYVLEASEYGIEKCKEKGLNCRSFILENNKKLPFDNGYFSMVIMNQVIEHVDKETGQFYIREIFRVLESGGVGIIKSPSRYSYIWKTDPHHVYCWKPNEMFKEIKKYIKDSGHIKLQRVPLEPWMFFKYNEKIIDNWHKYNRYPVLKKIFHISAKILDTILSKFTKEDFLLATSNVTFVKENE